MSDRLTMIDAEIGVLTWFKAVETVLAGYPVWHLRDGTFRKGGSLEYPVLREHRCDALRAVSRDGDAPPSFTPPF